MQIWNLAVTALAFSVGTACAEPAFKQEPPGNLQAYFQKMVIPNYPQVARIMHKSGKGWFALRIDRETGVVQEVKVLKSTGVKILDDSIATAFLQSKAKPHTLDHAIVPYGWQGYLRSHAGSHIGR